MEIKELKYLVMSRLLTYIFVYVASVIIMGNNYKTIAIYTLLFFIILIISTIRSLKLQDKKILFIIFVYAEMLIIDFCVYKFNSFNYVYLYIITVDIFLFLKPKEGILVSLPLYGSIFLAELWSNPNSKLKYIFISFLLWSLILVFFSAASYIIRKTILMNKEINELNNKLKESKDELETANSKLFEYSKKVEDTAIINERNRLAGEIHDTIGHSLTALIMELDICSKLIEIDTPKAKTEFAKAQELARYSLSEVRKSVRAIKTDGGLVGVNAIKELIRDFEKSSGILVSFDISKQQYKLSPAIEVTVYRIVQEALTNCAKYGHAKKAEIELMFKDDGIGVLISNDGDRCKDIKKGVGLTTMCERVEVLGGTISISGGNGFSINVFIPVEDKK